MITKIIHPHIEDRTDFDSALYPISCGYYKVDASDIGCKRENGRDDYFIFYVLKGKSSIVMDGIAQTVSQGDFVFYDFGDRQEYKHLSEFETEVYWLHFGGRNAKKILLDLGITKSMVLHCDTDLSFHFENILRELTYKKEHYHKIITGSIYMIFASAVRKITVSDSELDIVISSMNRMENNSLTIDNYAKMCNLSRSHFIKRFKEYTGDSPIRFKNRIIINNAKWYLKNTNCSISEISNILGFENIYYFSNMFKKQIGISPLGYRCNRTT